MGSDQSGLGNSKIHQICGRRYSGYLFNATLDEDYTKYNGLFLDMTPYLTEELTPNILTMFEEEPDTKVLATTMEGKIFGTPKFQGKWPSTNTVMFINQNWLDNLGLEMPTTYTEFKDVLLAFKERGR